MVKRDSGVFKIPQVRRSMTVVSILMLSQPIHTRITSNLTFQRKTDQHSESHYSKVREVFLYSLLNTTRFLIGIKMDRAKFSSVGKLKYA